MVTKILSGGGGVALAQGPLNTISPQAPICLHTALVGYIVICVDRRQTVRASYIVGSKYYKAHFPFDHFEAI